MTISVRLIEEPQLLFANGQKCVDPKVGLLSYGPNGLDVEHGKTQIIRAGAIGTHSSLIKLRGFLDELSSVIPPQLTRRTRSEPWKREFPGLGIDGALGFGISIDPAAVEPISEDEQSKVIAPEDRKQRIVNALDLYDQKFDDLRSAHPSPDIVFVPLSEKLVEKCKDPSLESDWIIYQKRTMDKHFRGTDIPVFNFHHAIKVLSFRRDLASQVVLPSTLNFVRKRQDRATIAWNFAVAVYYKATGTPWKLVDLDERTCMVGISFYPEMSKEGSVMRTSMAHVYVRTGESQIIRGKPFRWESDEPRREPTLDSGHAEEILRDVISLYARHREGMSPTRVVVHKTSPFTQDEIVGFDRAVEGIPQADYVHIESKAGVRFYHEGLGYPPVRGTLIAPVAAKSPAILYTVGFVPALGTYQGANVPFPLVLRIARLDTNHRIVAEDILRLSKMDWNTADFCRRTPVTISVSKKVGDILAEMRARDIENPPSLYKHYM